jgi:hypothetical protein
MTGRDDSTLPDPIPGEGDPVATGAKGGGEWPEPDVHPVEPAPGIDPARAAEIERERDGIAADVDPEVYDRDPRVAGSGSAPRDPAD